MSWQRRQRIPSPIAIETAKTSKGFFTFPLLLDVLLTKGGTIIADPTSAPIRVVFASAPMIASPEEVPAVPKDSTRKGE